MTLPGFRSSVSLVHKTGSMVIKQALFKTPSTSPLPHYPIFLVMCRRWESSKPAVEVKKLSANMQLKTLKEPSPEPRPLVLLFGWMLAKQRHLDKYGNLYHSKGFDVLSLKMQPSQVLLPQRAQATVVELLSQLCTPELISRPLLVHGFSVGGYVYGEYLVKLEQYFQMYADIHQRMVGQIFDSPVDFEGIPSGFANVLSNNAVGRTIIQKSLEAYLRLMEKPITSHYIRSSKAFHDNFLGLPSLMLYSRSDPIGVDRNIDRVIGLWKEKGIPVMSKCWESSPHVSHFHRHPDEYVEAVLKFLDSVGLSRQTGSEDKDKVLRDQQGKKSVQMQQAQ